MAEEESGQEKTEDASLKRLEKAREDGQVARSRELGTTLLLMTGAISMLIFGASLADRFQSIMRANFGFDRNAAMDTNMMAAKLGDSLSSVFDIVGLILFLLMLAGVIGAIGVGFFFCGAKPHVGCAKRSQIQNAKTA